MRKGLPATWVFCEEKSGEERAEKEGKESASSSDSNNDKMH